jgi:hypothetical protein
MKNWLRRVRGAMGMGLTWAVGWAIGGLMIGITSKLLPFVPLDWFFDVFDAPLPAMAVPGFFAGVFFSFVLGVAARHRTFRELSLPKFAVWGALGGVLLTAFPFALAASGLASLNVNPLAVLPAIGIPFVVFGAISAATTLKVARRAEVRELSSPSQGSLPQDV